MHWSVTQVSQAQNSPIFSNPATLHLVKWSVRDCGWWWKLLDMADVLLGMSSLSPLFCRVSELSRLCDKYFHAQASSKPWQRLGAEADREVFSEPGSVRFRKKESVFTFLAQEPWEVRTGIYSREGDNSYLWRGQWRANDDCGMEYDQSAIHQSFPWPRHQSKPFISTNLLNYSSNRGEVCHYPNVQIGKLILERLVTFMWLNSQ